MTTYATHIARAFRASTLATGLSLAVLLGSGLRTDAQQTTHVNFSATNQSLWNTGTTSGMNQDQYMVASWATGDVGKAKTKHVPVLGTFGGGYDANSSGMAGLRVRSWSDPGQLNINYPVDYTTYTAKNQSEQTLFTFLSAQPTLDQAGMTTKVNRIDNAFYGVLKSDSWFEGWVKTFGKKSSSRIPVRFNLMLKMFDTSSMPGVSLTLFDVTASYNKQASALQTTGSVNSDGSITSTSGNGPASFSLTGHLTDMMIDLIKAGVAPESEAADQTVANRGDILKTSFDAKLRLRDFDLKLGWHIADMQAKTYTGYRQNFRFTPMPIVRLHRYFYKTGSSGDVQERLPLDVYPGQTVDVASKVNGENFGTWASTGLTMAYTVPEYILSNTLTNDTYLQVTGGLYFVPLDIYCAASIARIGSFDLGHFQPTPTIDLVSAHANDKIYSKTFQVQFPTTWGNPIQ